MKKDFLPLSAETRTVAELNQTNGIVLAFVGDAVQTLYVRARLSYESSAKTAVLHRLVANEVNAARQAAAAAAVTPFLTEEEEAVYKRVRNSNVHTVPKHASPEDYRHATGFEGLIGYLYLKGAHDRLNEILEIAYNNNSATETQVSDTQKDN